MCLVHGAEEPLLHQAARHCFHDAPLTALRELCKVEGVKDVGGPTLYDHCLALIKHFLPGLPENDVTQILSLRLFENKFAYSAFLTDDRIRDDVFEGDSKVLDDYLDDGRCPLNRDYIRDVIYWLKGLLILPQDCKIRGM